MDGSKELHDEMRIVVHLYPNVLIDPKLLANLNSLSKVVQLLFHIVSVDTKLPHNLGLELGKNLIEDLFLKQGVKTDRKSTRLNSSHSGESRMPSSA